MPLGKATLFNFYYYDFPVKRLDVLGNNPESNGTEIVNISK
jgi:hypothetical protein